MEKPVRTIAGFSAIAVAAAVTHRVRFTRVLTIPARGPAILVVNHLSTLEALAVARMVIGHRRFPHFLVMAQAFDWPVVGAVLRAARQIPVDRGTDAAASALERAADELRRGHVVVLYPEGRLTRDPDLWPGPGRTGAARLALAHPDVPLIPVGLWGPRPGRRHLLHRHTARLLVGDPIDLSGWAARRASPPTGAGDDRGGAGTPGPAADRVGDPPTVGASADGGAARAATEVIMARIRELVARLRDPHPLPSADAGRPGSAGGVERRAR